MMKEDIFKKIHIPTTRKELSRLVKRILWFVATATAFAVLVIWIAFYLIDSPKEKMLMRENNELKEQIEAINAKLSKMDAVLTDIEERDDNIYRSIFEEEPVPENERFPFANDNYRYSNLSHDEAIALIENTLQKTDEIIVRLNVQEKSLDTVELMVAQKSAMLSAIPAIIPLKNIKEISSGFGSRYHPILKTLRKHTGVDIAAPKGTPVYATADGVVSRENGGSGYGINVVINHGYSYKTVYAHLSKKSVKPGQKIKRGQLIGYVGNTGLSFGSHLHYEVRKNDIPVNPVHYFFNDITPEEYEQILESSKKINQALS
ncbi:MAG: M23 family metallopeptidase [Bacteroidales bacterium]|nr:M23 family metallopeptidase [Bacteroidales bacterium]